MSKTKKFDPFAFELLTSGKYRSRVVKAKKGKTAYKRNRKPIKTENENGF